jgi:integrase
MTRHTETIDTPYRDKHRAWEYALKFAWDWARDHGVTDRAAANGEFMRVFERWLREQAVRPMTEYHYLLAGRAIAKHLPDALAAITRQDVLNMLRAMRSTMNGNTIAQKLGIFRMFIRWAVAECFLDADPTKHIKIPHSEVRLGLALSYDEARRLLAESKKRQIIKCGKFYRRLKCGQYMYWFLKISLHTGLRKSNVLGLRWSMIDIHERKITIPGQMMKTRRDFVIPMHPELALGLRHYRSFRSSDIVLGRRFTSIFRSFKGVKARAGFPDLVVHDLRHTASTWFHMQLPWNYAETLVGRKIQPVGGCYFHPPFWDLRDRVDKLPWIEPEE